MALHQAKALLPDGQPGPWGEPVAFSYDRRDVLLYAVGIGIEDLRFVYEGHPEFAVFPTFPIRWGSAGAPVDRALLPPSPGPLNIDAERYIEQLRPLPIAGTLQVRSRLIGVHPRGKGSSFVETESVLTDAAGEVCVRMVNGSFRRGVEQLGDIETRAVLQGDAIQLSGAKTLVCDAAVAEMMLVSVALDGAPALVLVRASDLQAQRIQREVVIDETRRSYRVDLTCALRSAARSAPTSRSSIRQPRS